MIEAPIDVDVDDLKILVKERGIHPSKGILAKDLNLWKVRCF